MSDSRFTVGSGESATHVELKAPWSKGVLTLKNNEEQTLVIVAITAKVLGPDGNTREISLEFYNDAGEIINPIETINPQAEKTLPNLYIADLLSGFQGPLEPFYGSSFSYELKFEGWFEEGGVPKRNFIQRIFFTGNSSL